MAVSLLLWPGHSCDGSWWRGPATVTEVVGSRGGAIFNLPVSCLNFVDRCKAVLCDTWTFDKLWPVLPGNPRPSTHLLLMQCLPDWKMKMFHFLFKHTMFSWCFVKHNFAGNDYIICASWTNVLNWWGTDSQKKKSMLFPFPPCITTNTVCFRLQLIALSAAPLEAPTGCLTFTYPFQA